MKIYHSYHTQQHEIEFTKKDIINEEGIRNEPIEGSCKRRGLFGSPNYHETWSYNKIAVINSYLICPICGEKVLIKTIDKTI